MIKNLHAHAGSTGVTGLIPRLERSPGVGNDNLLQYSFLEDPKDRGALWATVYGITRVRHDCACMTQKILEGSYLQEKGWELI